MARFNQKRVAAGPDTINLAGGEAFQESAELELVSILLTSMVQDQFYRSGNQTLERLSFLVDTLLMNGQAFFIAQAGIYARREFGLRSITHVLAALLARRVRGADWTKDFYNVIVRRPDDITEILALVLKSGENIPNALKDGFARALGRMNAYGLAKYQGKNRDVKMVDAINLTHPKHTQALGDMIHGTLKPADTWEAGLSAAGQKTGNATEKDELKSAVWTDLIANKKIGYLALLRNIRNILLTVQEPDVLTTAARMIVDPESIKKSLVFPFQIHTAYDSVCGLNIPNNHTKMFVSALIEAAEVSLYSNVPKFDGPTLIAIDLSGSMTGGMVGTSTAAKVGGLFAAVLWKANMNSDLIVFGSHAQYAPMSMHDLGLFTMATALGQADQGGTNFHEIFRTANRAYDRIIIISDCQAWEEHETPRNVLSTYSKKFNCQPHIYSLDLCGMGTLQFPEKKVYAMAGFSEKIFDIMKMLETDRNALINEIKKINIASMALGLTRK